LGLYEHAALVRMLSTERMGSMSGLAGNRHLMACHDWVQEGGLAGSLAKARHHLLPSGTGLKGLARRGTHFE